MKSFETVRYVLRLFFHNVNISRHSFNLRYAILIAIVMYLCNMLQYYEALEECHLLVFFRACQLKNSGIARYALEF